jgi:hypothetical protein
VFFFAGYGGKSVILGQSSPILCVNCHNTNPHNILENTKRLSVFFISIVKWEYKYFSVCPVCTRGPELKNKEAALRVIAESFGGVR